MESNSVTMRTLENTKHDETRNAGARRTYEPHLDTQDMPKTMILFLKIALTSGRVIKDVLEL